MICAALPRKSAGSPSTVAVRVSSAHTPRKVKGWEEIWNRIFTRSRGATRVFAVAPAAPPAKKDLTSVKGSSDDDDDEEEEEEEEERDGGGGEEEEEGAARAAPAPAAATTGSSGPLTPASGEEELHCVARNVVVGGDV